MLLFFVVLWSLAVTSLAAKTLPPEYLRCNVTQADYEKCFFLAVKDSFIHLRSGIPSLGVLPLEPLAVNEIAVKEGRGAAQFALTLSNVSIYGLKDLSTVAATSKLPEGDLDLHAEIFIPRFEVLSDYSISGRVLILPISGAGKSNITLYGFRVVARMHNKLIEKNGKQFLEVDTFTTDVKPQAVTIHFENLFNGNQQLARQMDIILNENSLEIFEDLRPGFQDAFGEIFKQISNRVFLKVPFKDIFLH